MDKSLPKSYMSVLMAYPLLKVPGMFHPDKKYGYTVLRPDYTFHALTAKDITVDMLKVMVSEIINRNMEPLFEGPQIAPQDRSAVLNQHFDLAQLLCVAHSKKFPDFVSESIAGLEKLRGNALAEIVEQDDMHPSAWAEYAYWLTAQADKIIDSDPSAANTLLDNAELNLRNAHAAGYIEATEALATFLYQYRATDGSWKVDEVIGLWEVAACTGNAMAIQNLHSVVMADDSLTDDERCGSLVSIWDGIAMNPKNPVVMDVRRTLKKSGLTRETLLEPVPA